MENSTAVPTYAQTRAAMILRGTTLTTWARAKGHHPRYVRNVLLRWGGRKGAPGRRKQTKPWGTRAQKIIRDLTRTLAKSGT